MTPFFFFFFHPSLSFPHHHHPPHRRDVSESCCFSSSIKREGGVIYMKGMKSVFFPMSPHHRLNDTRTHKAKEKGKMYIRGLYSIEFSATSAFRRPRRLNLQGNKRRGGRCEKETFKIDHIPPFSSSSSPHFRWSLLSCPVERKEREGKLKKREGLHSARVMTSVGKSIHNPLKDTSSSSSVSLQTPPSAFQKRDDYDYYCSSSSS